jgi:hypothetical protein
METDPKPAPEASAQSADPSVVPAPSTPAPLPQQDSHGSPSPRRRWLRRLVSLCILYHVAAIIVAPAAVAPSSEIVQVAWRAFRPYLQFFYLNHGYHYFAPEPSSSTLVGYTLEFEDGKTETGRFPHRGIAPRLLYHRHFMLTEFLGFVDDDDEQPWHRSYARHLCKTYNAKKVSLSRITHLLPTAQGIREGRTLNDSEGFTEVPLGSYSWDDF